jgi:hypothetical protein
MRRVFFAFILSALLLSSCGTFEIYFESTPEEPAAAPAPAATVEPTLSSNSTSEEIQRAMLESATKWKSIWMDGMVTYFPMEGTGGPTTVSHEQVWIDLSTNRFRVLTGPVGGAAEKYLSSDGASILELDLQSGLSQSRPLPEMPAEKQFVPTLQPGYAYPQPLWGQMGTPLSQLAFTSDFAQNEGTFKPVGTESIANREALIVEWTHVQSQLPSWRMWLDTKTAVILKMQSFEKGGGTTVRSEALVNQVSFDDVFANSLFGIPSTLPQFGDITGHATEAATGAGAPSGRDELGELYFFELPHQGNRVPQLVHMPGLCAVGEVICPKIEPVTLLFPFIFAFPSFSWSPDGNLAAFVYPDNQSGTPLKLWLFDPAANTWNSLWEYPYIDPPMWSPDGEWLAFRQQDGSGGEDIMTIRRDGSDLKNLTVGGDLPIDGRPYSLDGWINGSVLVHSAKFAGIGETYLVRVTDGHVQSMRETSTAKAIFVPSHDGAWLAYDDYANSSMGHSIRVSDTDGANPVELASFAGGSLFPIVWSPEDNKIAFVYYTEPTQGNQMADVYVINRDGTGLQQVYKGAIVSSILFSPDGKHLLINESSSATGSRLYVVNLATLEQRLIESPGLTLDSDWYLPSWRK